MMIHETSVVFPQPQLKLMLLKPSSPKIWLRGEEDCDQHRKHARICFMRCLEQEKHILPNDGLMAEFPMAEG